MCAEGGFLTTNNEKWAAQCIYWAGAYEQRYNYHLAAPTENTGPHSPVQIYEQPPSLIAEDISVSYPDNISLCRTYGGMLSVY